MGVVNIAHGHRSATLRLLQAHSVSSSSYIRLRRPNLSSAPRWLTPHSAPPR